MSLYKFIEKTSFEDSKYDDSNWNVWKATDMYDFIKKNKIKKEKIHIASMHHKDRYIQNNNITLIEHINRIKKTKLKYPIVIHYDWNVMDWYHRIAKAIMKKKKWIWAYRINIFDVKQSKDTK